jgi:transcriptional regulator with XRE-family HTH domain
MVHLSAPTQVSAVLARLRAEIGATQAAVAEKAGLDQSRISRIEKGEVSAPDEIDRVLSALASLGAKDAVEFRAYAKQEWLHVEPPSFWNPQRACLEIAEETLREMGLFLADTDRPWPLRRQIEKHQDSLQRAAAFLTRLDHNIAFIGDMGVGKSTAISFLFDLLIPPSLVDKLINRPVLETGAGGTTICEVHIKSGPEFGISLLPVGDVELRELIADFCAAKWMAVQSDRPDKGENAQVSREHERAIRNMAALGRRAEMVGGKRVYHDPVVDLVRTCATEEEFRTKVIGRMNLPNRTRRELWYDSATRKHPMEWVAETFRAVNNGRLADVTLPLNIDILIPNFERGFGELTISVIDTKGVDDVAVREDLDTRLKDPRTAVIFCTRFNDAPGTATRILLRHMRQTFSERVDTGKVAILALPRADEARAMKDDMGEQALTDAEGYEFKRMQVANELQADDLGGVPTEFFNVETDDAAAVRHTVAQQIDRMRKSVEDRLFDLCAASQDIIKHHETQALNAALEEVAKQLNNFLTGNRSLGAREQLAHAEAIATVKGIRYASTLWAATRRNGTYSGLNIVHLTGVGAARDARQRSASWFNGLSAFLKSLSADPDLKLAKQSILQIAATSAASRTAFLESVQQAATEVYREPLTQAAVWGECAGEWGLGAGFKMRVAARLERWFMERADLKQVLEDLVNSLWEQTVLAPLMRLVAENAPEVDTAASNVVPFLRSLTA